MKITRYTQSCLLIEQAGARILIDPSAQEKENVSRFGQLDAVFYTHEHADHFDPELAQTFVEQGVAPVYANASTAKLIQASKTVVKNGQEFDISGLKVKAIELPHCLMPDGSPGPQNTGYLVNGELFHPGDGKELAGLKVRILALPVIGPDISLKDAFSFAKQVSAKDAVPVHYDFWGLKPDLVKALDQRYKMPFKLHYLQNGQTAEI